jgi:hypothetical protein
VPLVIFVDINNHVNYIHRKFQDSRDRNISSNTILSVR